MSFSVNKASLLSGEMLCPEVKIQVLLCRDLCSTVCCSARKEMLLYPNSEDGLKLHLILNTEHQYLIY